MRILPPTPLLVRQNNESQILFKCESDQPIGSFKLRGAWHRLTDLSSEDRSAGVVAFSSGNHAQGVAWAAKRLGIAATIVMPSDAPLLKVEGTRSLGADIRFYDRYRESREAIAAAIAKDTGAVLVPSFDDPWIIEGQGSVGLEVSAQSEAPVDLVVVPCGGGGLAAGIALALPESHIVVVEPEGWHDMAMSLQCGRIIPVDENPPATSCDALQTPRVSPLTFDILHARNAEGVSVTEQEVGEAMEWAHRCLGRRIEPGGAVALAAILSGKVAAAARTLVVLSGSNVEPDLFAAMISR